MQLFLRSNIFSSFLLLLLFFCGSSPTEALKFDIQAHPAGQHKWAERCIRNFVARDTLVIVTATIGGHKGDGQRVDMHVSFFVLLLLLCRQLVEVWDVG